MKLLALFSFLAVTASACGGTLTLTQKQRDFRVQTESVTRKVNLSGDRYDSYYAFSISDRSGAVQITIPIAANGQAKSVRGPDGRAVPISFECDYSSGAETRGKISVRYRDPRNLYGLISGNVEAVCIPLSSEEVEQQNAREQGLQEELAKAQAMARADQARREEEERRKAEITAAKAREREQQRLQKAEEESRKEAEFVREQQKTKPPCTDVVVNGLIASSVMDVEALHASHLTPAGLEDVLARHPYSCQINLFGVAYGCRGGAFVSGRRATIKNWSPTHYVVEIPLDFQMGRRDAPAWVRRSEVKCTR